MSTEPEEQQRPKRTIAERARPWVLRFRALLKRIDARICRWFARQWQDYRGWETREDAPVLRWWQTLQALAWFFFCGPLLILLAWALHDDGVLSEAGLLLIMVGLMGTFAAVRRLVAAWVARVTRGQVRERDLWRGDRILLYGVVLLMAPSLIAVYVMKFETAQTTTVLTVATALLIIGPATEWARNDGVWPLVKERLDRAAAKRVKWLFAFEGVAAGAKNDGVAV